jgi:hypothetical protein
MTRQIAGSPFLYSDNGNDIVGFKDPDGTDILYTSTVSEARNQSELKSILNAYGFVNIPKDADFLVDNLTIPNGSRIYGKGTIRWNSDSLNTPTLTMGSDCVIEGITMRRLQSSVIKSNAKIIINISGNSENITLDGIKFYADLDDSFTTYENFIFADQNCQNIIIKNCHGQYGGNSILLIAASHCHVINNFFKDGSNGIRFYGGKYNNVSYNKIIGRNVHNTQALPSITGQSTLVGINFLTFGFLGAKTGIVGNQIIGNEIYGVSEEGIGLDTHGQVFANSVENKAMPVVTVNSIAQASNKQTITIQENTTVNGIPSVTGWADECYAVVLTGPAAGYMAPIITGSSTASDSPNTAAFIISDNNGILQVAAGDKILITYGIIDNIIANNVINSTTTGISLWGGCWRNQVSNNIISAIDIGIQVAEVLGGPVTPNVNTYTISYSGINTIYNNIVTMEYKEQPNGVARGWSPLIVGVFAYGAPSAGINHHIGTEVTNNQIYSARNIIIGGQLPGFQDPGFLSIYGGRIANNKIMGGGKIAVNKTSNLFVGPNYLHVAREDYNIAASASNTALVVAP